MKVSSKDPLLAQRSFDRKCGSRLSADVEIRRSVVDEAEGNTYESSRRARTSAPQLQHPLSWLHDRTQLWRLKITSWSTRGWQQMQGLKTCVTRMSHLQVAVSCGRLVRGERWSTGRLRQRTTGGSKQADPTTTTEPRGLTASRPQPADIHSNGSPRTRRGLDVSFFERGNVVR